MVISGNRDADASKILRRHQHYSNARLLSLFKTMTLLSLKLSINVRDILNLLYTSSHWILPKKSIGLLFSSPKMRMRFAKITCQIIVETS